MDNTVHKEFIVKGMNEYSVKMPWIMGEDWAVPYSQITDIHIREDEDSYNISITTTSNFVYTIYTVHSKDQAIDAFYSIVKAIVHPEGPITQFVSGCNIKSI